MIDDKLDHLIHLTQSGFHAMHKEIADLIATIGPLVTQAAAIEDEVKVQQGTIEDIQSKLANGNALDADDIAALATAAQQIVAVTGGMRDAAVKVAPAVDAVVSAIPPAASPSASPSSASPPQSAPVDQSAPAPEQTATPATDPAPAAAPPAA